jgi:hypothetical protein
MKSILFPFFTGVLMLGFGVAALFFLKFWRRSGERLFAWFAAAFLLLSLNQLAFALIGEREERSWVYVLRILGFALIIWGVIDKNRRDA